MKKNGSVCSEKMAKVTMNSLMSTCRCGRCEPGEVFLCRKCDLTFKCEDEYDVHRSLQHYRSHYRVIKNSLMSTCRCGLCEPGKVFLCKKCDLTFNCEDEYDDHKNWQHYRVSLQAGFVSLCTYSHSVQCSS